MCFFGRFCVFVQQFGYLCLFRNGTSSHKPQNLRTMTFITQHKPIERSTDMVFMPKTSQIQIWLKGLYMIILWQNEIVAQNSISAKSYLGIWDKRWPLSKQNTLFKEKRFCKLAHERAAIWLAKEPLLIFTAKTAARTPWSKRTPQEPEWCAIKSQLVALMGLRRTLRFPKGGARLGCVLS